MIETLTVIFVLLSVLALALIATVVYLVVSSEGSSGECPHCGGSGRTVVHNRSGLMSRRCPRCNA